MDYVLSQISRVRPALRLCSIQKTDDAACGFHLSRTQWDPYPWISNVDAASPAEEAGLTIGDFVIEVNGEDILGLRIDEVAQKVRLKNDVVNLLVWKSAITETENQLPAAFNLQKFCGFLQSTLQLLECPVCLDVVSVPTFQCVNGHIICGHCRQKTEKCPMCRVIFSANGRCLIAEKLHRLIRKTLSVKSCNENVNHKVSTNEGVASQRKAVRHESVAYFCPWGSSCCDKLLGENAVFRHLQKCHDGPVIQYTIRDDTVTVMETSSDALVCIASPHEEIFFLQKLQSRQYFLRILGDSAKANQFQYRIETADGVSDHSHQVSALSEPIEKTIAQKSFFTVSSSGPGLIITVSLLLKNTRL